ncbi:LexA-binding, inner membrane-associated putative hydrolase [Rathayibacter oskolensis]|uniref:LexA-binding, inner membrane-associated putative hydrolase n=1 Tax=Rathayibacter oskolensis TaxID=1891671 RepID=A0A1X7NP02_9MICO|nr:metal-dependent hydrolase [Rathayibacter oskolensis]SMH39697.1 LexA-binding, inner membrane-associated putative hydrolase [Rathayibacter oskolensis]
MMGRSHAVSGALAWAVATSVPALAGPLGIAELPLDLHLVGLGVAAGWALVPDADHARATVSRSAPGASILTATAGRISGGHRHGMHSLLAVAIVWALVPVLTDLRFPVPVVGPVSVAALLTLPALAFAARAVRAAPSWPVAWAGAGVVTVLLIALADGTWAWLRVAATLGYLVHVAGDALTTEGINWLWPLRLRSPRWVRRTPLRHLWTSGGYAAIPVLGSAGSWRETVLYWLMSAATIVLTASVVAAELA